MKLDNLKATWQQYTAQAASVHQLSENQIAGLLKVRTENAVTKLKKSIYFELAVQAFTVVLCAVGAFMTPGDVVFSGICLFIAVLCLPFLGYFWARLQYLKRLNVTSANLRATLGNLTEMVAGLSKLYFRTNILLAPVCLIAGQLVYYKLGKGLNISQLPWEEMYLRLGIGLVLGAVLGYFFLKWYIRSMFGNHLKALQAASSELESLEEAA